LMPLPIIAFGNEKKQEKFQHSNYPKAPEIYSGVFGYKNLNFRRQV